ncbi:MAG: hypothetical protein OQK12_18440 [Motiliproteus sp.]|nr:hypothetical protein [Motiliproteus sp.]MCW9053001.1 hypothetical protein [Motiliproteus sp.]
MLRSLGFITGSLLVGATLYVIAQSPSIVQKASDGTLTQQDLQQAVNQSKQNLQSSIAQSTSPPSTTRKTPTPLSTGPRENPKNTVSEKPAFEMTAVANLTTNAKPDSASEVSIDSTSHTTTDSTTQPHTADIQTVNTERNPANANSANQPSEKASFSKQPASSKDLGAEQAIAQVVESAKNLSNQLSNSSLFPTAPLAKEPNAPTPEPASTNPPSSKKITISIPPDPHQSVLEPTIGESNWYPVWDGFRSEISAKGFSHQLAKQSGRELRVERIGRGRYQVQMRFQDEQDLQQGLQQIGMKTGLKLSERTL